jgi:hypothetical protein
MKPERSQKIFYFLIFGFFIFLSLLPVSSLADPDQILPIPAPTSLAFEPNLMKNVFEYGENIPIPSGIRNDGELPANLSGVPPEIVVSIRNTGWDRGIVRTIPAGKESLTLGPHARQSWIVSWDQKDNRGIQVQPGVYYLTMNASGVNTYAEVVIQYPEGALTGTISPMQNITSRGITTRLESIALQENEGQITIRVIPPSDPRISGSPGFSQITSEYNVDDGSPVNFRDLSGKYTENGEYEITWRTAPISCNAKVMGIRATKFDPYEGDWNFSINLDSFSLCTSGNGTAFPRVNTWGKPGISSAQSPLPIVTAILLIGLICAVIIFISKKKP